MFKRNIAMILALASFINPVLVFADEAATQKENFNQHISNIYLNATFGPTDVPVTPAVDPNAGLMEKLNAQMDPKAQMLTSREAQEAAFSMVSSTQNFDTDIIDTSCIDKLEIIGGGENKTLHLFGNIFKHINTSTGKAHAAFTFCHPITDTQTLINRQNAIIFLKENSALLEQFNISLKNTSPFEAKSFMYWHSKPAVNQELIRNSYFGSLINLGSISNELNTNTTALEAMNRFYIANLAAIPAMFVHAIHKVAKKANMPFSTVMIAFFKDLKSLSINAIKSASVKQYAMTAAGAVYFGGLSYFIGKTYYSYEKMYKHIQDILITTSSHIKELQTVSTLLNENPELLAHLPSLQPLANLNNPAKHSAQLNKLLSMLNTDTFTGEASFFSIAGRILAAYELMKHVKDELAPVFAAAGELDMYVALAKLYNEHEDKDARYCMVNFIENSTTPVINAQGFWNPFIDADKVVINDVLFDTTCPNSILTGPNTG